MKRLNNKGYLLIEIVLAASIAFTIAFSLLKLIIDFKNKNEDIYGQTIILTEKTNITKNIMDDIKDGIITEINQTSTEENKEIIDFNLETKDGETKKKRLQFTKPNNKTERIITYGDIDNNGNFITGNKSYYKRELTGAGIDIGKVKIETITEPEGKTNNPVKITIPVSSTYTKEKHDIILILESKRIPIIKKITDTENNDIWKYKNDATKIIIDNKQTKIEGAEEYDISSLNNRSVLAYYNAASKTIYIEGDGKIIANTDSSYLFNDFTKVEEIIGLENIDTSNVTNMEGLFQNLGSQAQAIAISDMSSWNTEKVTNMKKMFSNICQNCINPIELKPPKIYATEIESIFEGTTNINTTIEIYNTPTSYSNAFKNTATSENSQIKVKYKDSVTNIDDIINTKNQDNNKIIKDTTI